MVQAVFGAYGQIKWCKALPSTMPGKKSAALVQFDNPLDAQWFCENLNGNIPEGLSEPVQVKFSAPPGSGKGKGKDKGKDKGGFGKANGGFNGGMPMAAPGPYDNG